MAKRGTTRIGLRVAALGAIASVLALATIPLYSTIAAAAGKPTTTTLTATSPAYTGEPIVFTATVTRGTNIPTGSVTFSITGNDGSTPVCDGGSGDVIPVSTPATGPVVAQCSISAGLYAAANDYSVIATYSGDSTFAGSTSATLMEHIERARTTTTVTPSSNPTVTGQPVSFMAVVTANSPATGIPTGSVAFTIAGADGSTASCDGLSNTIALTGDEATCVVSGGLERTGNHYTVTAVYSGDPNDAVSTGTASQQVIRAGVTIGVTSSPSTIVTGQPVWFTASILTVISPGAGTPTGSIDFSVVGSNGSTATCDGVGGDTVALSGERGVCLCCRLAWEGAELHRHRELGGSEFQFADRGQPRAANLQGCDVALNHCIPRLHGGVSTVELHRDPPHDGPGFRSTDGHP